MQAENAKLRRKISYEKPLFIYSSVYNGAKPDQLRKFWKLLPLDVKPYFAVHINPAKKGTEEEINWIKSVLDAAQELHVPAIIEVEGFDSKNPTPMSTWPKLFDKYSVLTGLNISELGATGLLTGAGMDKKFINKMIEYIDIAASKGGYFIWQDMGYDWPFPKKAHVFIRAGADEKLYSKIVENGDHIIFVHKHNGNGRRATTDAAALGFWTSGIVSNWGVHSEGWLWWEAGYERLFKPSVGYLRGREQWKSVFTFPDAQHGMEWLLGVAGGATVFSLEPYSIGYSSCEGDQLTPAFQNVLLPLMRKIIRDKLIPGREQVIQKIKAAYHPLKENDKVLRNDALFKGLYGAEESTQYEWLPSTGRYYYLPVLPVLSDDNVLNKFPFVFDSAYYEKNLSSQEKKKTFFDALYPETGKGDAWFVNFGENWYIVNPNENRDITASFEFSLKSNAKITISGSISHHTFAIVKEKPHGISIHLSNYMIDSDADVWDNPDFPENNPCEYVNKKYIPNPTDNKLRQSIIVIKGSSISKDKIKVSTGKRGNFKTSKNGDTITVKINHNGTVDMEVKY